MSLFLASTAVTGILGSPLAGLLMQLDGRAGLHGWQWLFLLEGLLPVALGGAVYALLPDRPAHARWLSDAEKSWLDDELRAETRPHPHHVGKLTAALRDPRLWRLAALYFTMIMGLYGFAYWAPTMIKSVTPGASDLAVGSLTALPYLVGAATMVLIARHSDRTGDRRRHVAASCLTAAAGILLVATSHRAPAMLASLSLAAVGIFGALGPFWALATRFLRASAAAGGIAVVNSVGCLAGFVAPYAIGLAKQHTGTPLAGWALVAASLTCGSLLVLTLPPSLDSHTAP
jgi:ACS family tartrate transporter-like MFS transporter